MTFLYTNRFKMHFRAHVYILHLRNSSLGLTPRFGESKKQYKRAAVWKCLRWDFGHGLVTKYCKLPWRMLPESVVGLAILPRTLKQHSKTLEEKAVLGRRRRPKK